jgi:membrane-bound lytic murein transglycosylase D
MNQRKKIFLAAMFLAAVFLAGCASSGKRALVPDAPLHARPDAAGAGIAWSDESDPTAPVVPQDPSAAIDMTDVDNLIARARKASADSSFAQADSMLREAAAFLKRSSRSEGSIEQNEKTRLAVQGYVAEIFSIYDDRMPPEFSVPEEISAVIFTLHILESLFDTLTVSPQDSVFLTRLRNKRGAHYDVPVVLNDRVAKMLLSYMRTRRGGFDRWLYHAGYYLPVMKKMFAAAGLPQDLAYLPIIESGFNPVAYSQAHAAGIWQFIPSTGRNYNLRQNYWIDERRDPLKSTEAAIGYLGKLHKDFGDWHIALAAYNCGENGMARAIKRAGGVHDYWQLNLPNETMNYVPLYLASLIIAKNPDVFDFKMQNKEVFDHDTVFVNSCLEISSVASGINVPEATLTKINPHILRGWTPPDMTNVRLYLPKGRAGAFKEFYSGLSEDKKQCPETPVIAAADATPKKITYKVRKGDALYSIARKHNVSAKDIMKWNKLSSPNHIQAGQTLAIHVKGADTAPSAAVKQSAQQKQTTPAPVAAAKQPEQPEQQLKQVATSTPTPAATQISTPTPTPPSQTAPDEHTVQSVASSALTALSAETEQSEIPEYAANNEEQSVSQQSASYTVDEQLSQPVPIATVQPVQPPTADKPSVPSVQPALAKPADDTGKTEKISYKVRRGEALYGIARTHGVSVKDLMDWNNLSSPTHVQMGQTLTIYVKAGSPIAQPAPAKPAVADETTEHARRHTGKRVVKQGETLFGIARELQVPIDELARINDINVMRPMLFPGDTLRYTPAPGQAAAPQSNKVRYTIKSGDTLWSISQQFGTSVQAVRAENGLTDDSVIKAGAVLTITPGETP